MIRFPIQIPNPESQTPTAISVRDTEPELHLARLVEQIRRARWLQIRRREVVRGVSSRVPRIQRVEDVHDPLQRRALQLHRLREPQIELSIPPGSGRAVRPYEVAGSCAIAG